MKIFKTKMGFSDGDGKIFHADTIEYQGSFWIVPEWLDNPVSGLTMPARIISLDGLQYQKTPPERSGADFF